MAMWRPAAVELRMVSEDTRSGAAAATLLAIMPVRPEQQDLGRSRGAEDGERGHPLRCCRYHMTNDHACGAQATRFRVFGSGF